MVPAIELLRDGGFLNRLVDTGYYCRQGKNKIYRDLYSGVWINHIENPIDPMLAADNTAPDLYRRCEKVVDFFKAKQRNVLIDVGGGTGHFCRFLKQCCRGLDLETHVVEKEDIYPAAGGADKVQLTLHHVLEHLSDPVVVLNDLCSMYPLADLHIEVPAAHDPLLCRYQPPEFMARAFHPEHYVLHTKESLEYTIGQTNWWATMCPEEVRRYGRDNHSKWGAITCDYAETYGYDTLYIHCV